MLVLGSRSPQRRAILEQLGLQFRVVEPDAEELAGGDPRTTVVENARRKARAAHEAAPGAQLVLGADTAVVLDGRMYGKPADEGEAEQFLRRLSGRRHQVWGGIALRRGSGAESVDAAMTQVSFRPLETPELQAYLSAGEWRSRAGAYAIQGRGAALVTAVEGDYFNVVGLPVAAFRALAPELFGGREFAGIS